MLFDDGADGVGDHAVSVEGRRRIFAFEKVTVPGDDRYVDRLAAYAQTLIEGEPTAEGVAFTNLGSRRLPIQPKPALDPPRRTCTKPATRAARRNRRKRMISLFDEDVDVDVDCNARELTCWALAAASGTVKSP